MTPATTAATIRPRLSKLRTTSLDQITPADAAKVVARVVATHQDQTRITAAKFSSFI